MSACLRTQGVFRLCLVASAFFAPLVRAVAEAQPAVIAHESWGAVFAGKQTAFHFAVTSPASRQALVAWSLSVDGRVLARREQSVTVGPGHAAEIETAFELPKGKDGVILQATLVVSVLAPDGRATLAGIEKPLWVFPDNPLFGRTRWAETLKLSLFDPAGKTAARLSELKVPYREITRQDSIPGITDGVLLVGEGLSLKEYRGLASLMNRTAAAGVPVLCLALSEGELIVPTAAESGSCLPAAMHFRRNDIIHELDKRFDADGWPPDGKAAATALALRGDRGPVMGEIVADTNTGWPWIELVYGRGRLILCGFPVVAKWQESPTPRYLLLRMLEHIAQDVQATN